MDQGRFRSSALSLLVFTAIAVAWALFLLDKGGGLPSIGGKPYQVSAVLPSGAALAPGARVTVAGVDVGRVEAVARRGAGARVMLQIDDEAVLPLSADSRVRVRQHTPVGENYIAITQGASTRTLESGDAIPIAQADEFVDVDRLLSFLQGKTRERARQTIRSMGAALEGRGEQANDLVGGAAEFLDRSYRFVDVIHKDREQAARLIEQLGDVAAAIGQRDQAITAIADQGLTALGALRDRDEALRRTIDEFPESLRRIRTVSGTLQSVTAVAAPVVDDASAALRVLEPAVRRLPAASRAGRGVMNRLEGAAPVLETTLQRVTALSEPLPAALPKIHKSICELAPAVRYFKPRWTEMLHILIGLGSASNSYDATGNLVRLAPIYSENSISGQPAEVSQAANEILRGGLLGRSSSALNFHPYPRVGDLGTSVATTNHPIGPAELPETGFEYPRIKPDC